MNDQQNQTEAACGGSTLTAVLGYRLEWKAGEYCLYTPEDFAREVNTDTARIWGLFSEPQPGCSSEPAAYRGVFWCEAKYRKANAYMDPDAVPLYLGPVLHEPPMNEDVLHIFPSLVENRLRVERPDLYHCGDPYCGDCQMVPNG